MCFEHHFREIIIYFKKGGWSISLVKDQESRGEKVTSVSQADIPVCMCLHIQEWWHPSPGNKGVWSKWDFLGAEQPPAWEWGWGVLSFSTLSWGENVNLRQPQTGWGLCHWRGGGRCAHPESGLQRTLGGKSGALICMKQQRRVTVGGTGDWEQWPWWEHLCLPQGRCGNRMELFELEVLLPLLNLFQERKSFVQGLLTWCWCHQSPSAVGHSSCSSWWRKFPISPSTLELICGETGPSQEDRAWVMGSTHNGGMKTQGTGKHPRLGPRDSYPPRVCDNLEPNLESS